MDYFGDVVVFKNYNERVISRILSLLISISLFHDLLINLCVFLFFGQISSFSALVARRPSFTQRFFCASSFASSFSS